MTPEQCKRWHTHGEKGHLGSNRKRRARRVDNETEPKLPLRERPLESDLQLSITST